jgi:uncharacterized protein YndB with AHSA1/START domain
MTSLRSALEHYISIRQGLGYKYVQPARRLPDFVTFMEQQGADVITTKSALAWATLPPDRRPSWSIRLTDVRCFARHLVQIDPRTEVPPVRLEKFEEVTPNSRLVFSFGWEDAAFGITPGSSRIEIDLEPKDGGTQLFFVHSGLPEVAVEPHTDGWTHYHGRLAIVAAGGDPGPDPKIKQAEA